MHPLKRPMSLCRAVLVRSTLRGESTCGTPGSLLHKRNLTGAVNHSLPAIKARVVIGKSPNQKLGIAPWVNCTLTEEVAVLMVAAASIKVMTEKVLLWRAGFSRRQAFTCASRWEKCPSRPRRRLQQSRRHMAPSSISPSRYAAQHGRQCNRGNRPHAKNRGAAEKLVEQGLVDLLG